MNTKDEITLAELILIIYNFFKRYFIILFIFILLGLGYGYYKAKKTKPYYKTSALVSSAITYRASARNTYPNIYPLYDLLKQIEVSFTNKNYSFLKDSIGIADITKIKSLTVQLGEYRYSSPTEVIIDLQVYDPSVIKELSEKIANYCNSNNYLNAYLKGQQEFNDYIKKMLKQQDSLVKAKEQQYNLTDISYIPGIYNNKIIYTDYMIREPFKQPYILVKDFDYKPSPITEKTKQFLLGFAIFIILGFVVAFVFEIVRIIKNA